MLEIMLYQQVRKFLGCCAHHMSHLIIANHDNQTNKLSNKLTHPLDIELTNQDYSASSMQGHDHRHIFSARVGIMDRFHQYLTCLILLFVVAKVRVLVKEVERRRLGQMQRLTLMVSILLRLDSSFLWV